MTLFPLDGSPRPGLRATLEAGWASGLGTGLVVYDPAAAEVLSGGKYRYHHLPHRTRRPGALKDARPPPEGLRLPHAPCPFDGDAFIAEREIARVARSGRTYHLVSNRYPVTPLHFLAVRAGWEDPATLPQRLYGPEEIEDVLLLLAMLGPPYRAYFNSNRGSDDSRSGSSVNHWHFQFFVYPPGIRSELLDGGAGDAGGPDGVEVGEIRSWPARHVLVAAGAARRAAAAARLWDSVRRVNAADIACNLEVVALEDEAARCFLFPRAPGPEIELPGAGRLSPDFGGWELSGDIVIPTREILEWIARHPLEADEMTTERLRITTRSVP